jgi:hypothetical protein
LGVRIPAAESNEFPNDNPALHQGASWVCLDPLAAPRLVARPNVIAKAVAAPTPARPETVAAGAVRSTLLPPPSNEPTEADELVARFLARVSLAPAPAVPVEAARSQRMAPIAQFMLDELPNYKVRRTAARVPPPPAHAYVSSPTLRLEATHIDSPLALVESWLPPAPVAANEAPTDVSPIDLQWRAESPWSVLTPEPHLFRALGGDSSRPAPLQAPELTIDARVEDGVDAEPMTLEAEPAMTEVAPIVLQPEGVEPAPADEDPVLEVAQLMEVAPTPQAPAVEIHAPALSVEIPSESPVSGGVAPQLDGDLTASNGVYESFVAALSAVLLQRGATRGAAVIGSLLEGVRLETSALGETLVQQLTQAGIGEPRGELFLIDPEFARAASSWKTLLSAESEDFSSCAETLDDWATRLVSALLPNPAPVKDVRRELRRKGVAAFGMLAAA